MYSLLIFIFLVICFALVIVILLQSSKGGGLAGTFGGSDMGAVFGGRGAANFLSKATTWLAVGFLALSLIISLINKGETKTATKSLVQQEQQKRASVPAAGLPVVPTPNETGQVLPQPTASDTTK